MLDPLRRLVDRITLACWGTPPDIDPPEPPPTLEWCPEDTSGRCYVLVHPASGTARGSVWCDGTRGAWWGVRTPAGELVSGQVVAASRPAALRAAQRAVLCALYPQGNMPP